MPRLTFLVNFCSDNFSEKHFGLVGATLVVAHKGWRKPLDAQDSSCLSPISLYNRFMIMWAIFQLTPHPGRRISLCVPFC